MMSIVPSSHSLRQRSSWEAQILGGDSVDRRLLLLSGTGQSTPFVRLHAAQSARRLRSSSLPPNRSAGRSSAPTPPPAPLRSRRGSGLSASAVRGGVGRRPLEGPRLLQARDARLKPSVVRVAWV